MHGVAGDGRSLASVLYHEGKHGVFRRRQADGRRAHPLRQPALAVLLHAPGVHGAQDGLRLVNHQVRPFKHALLRGDCERSTTRTRARARRTRVPSVMMHAISMIAHVSTSCDSGRAVASASPRAAAPTARLRRWRQAHQARHLKVDPASTRRRGVSPPTRLHEPHAAAMCDMARTTRAALPAPPRARPPRQPTAPPAPPPRQPPPHPPPRACGGGQSAR